MSFSSEIKEWAAAAKELWQDEHRKHPYRRWFLTGFIFLYVLVHELLRWSEGK